MKIFTGAVPFRSCALITSVAHIIEGRRPPRPTSPVLTDDLWGLMQGCWSQDPQSRPQMLQVLNVVPSFVSQRFRRLCKFSKSSPKFRRALERFFDSTDYKDCITRLHGTTLQEFVNFLDDVRRQTPITFTNLILDLTFLPGVTYLWITSGTAWADVA